MVRKFDPYMTCPKCGATNLVADYVMYLEQIKRTCPICGYIEYQKPLDAKDDSKQEPG